MSSDIDPYAVLGVPKDATLPEVKSAHRKLVLKCHPDKIKDESLRNEAQDEFQKVQHAYELLSDDTRRTKYDQKVRLAELRREMKEQQQQHQRSYSSPRASHSREYRDGRIYEERMPADAFFDEAMAYHPDEPRTTSRKHDDFGRRPRTEEKKKPKGATTASSSSPFSGFRAARDAAREGTKASHSSRAKYRTKERRREAYEKYERGAYVDSDSASDSSAPFVDGRPEKQPSSSSRRSKPSKTRHPTDPRIYEEDDDDDDDYSDRHESKHDMLHTTARDYIRRSKGTVPIDVDPRNHRPSRSPPPRPRDYESAEPEQTSSARRTGGGSRSKRPSRETVRPSSSRNGSYEHLDTPSRTVPSMPTAATSPAAAKATRPSLQPSRSATTAGYSRSGPKRDAAPDLVSMVYADGTSRSSKLRTGDSGYSSPGTPEMTAGTSPPKNSTRYRVVTEPDMVLLEPEIPPSHPSSRYQRGYSPPHPHAERPPASVRAGSKPMRSHTAYVPESRYEKPMRPSSSARLFGQVDSPSRAKDSKDVKYAREYGPDYKSRESYHPRGYPYEDYRQPAPGRRQSAYA